MRTFFAILIICFMALAGCQKEVKQYENVKLVYEGGVNSNGVKEGSGKLYEPVTGKVIFNGMFKNGLKLIGTMYDKNGKNPHPYEE
ncbi:hypothetical protein [Bacillus salipaludis]|uniref:MORN repeat protein n=1 Tax=Bacillus salipaludis TaxID=2547811 RepID=A0AA90TWX3_9BACI|nr:hypothetical protein [Bacillus salipaludis]MDQ6601068.1 hypothetical protein [Bacillus salipaludis]